MNIVTLCTGNVARSVMLGYMLQTLDDGANTRWQVRTAGTHVYEGSSMSARTRNALFGIDQLGPHHYNAHRSHQLNASDVQWADVVLASEASHVRYVRANWPAGAEKAVLLGQFVRTVGRSSSWKEQLATEARAEPNGDFDVLDPAGGDQAAYDACARQLWEMAQAFMLRVGGLVD